MYGKVLKYIDIYTNRRWQYYICQRVDYLWIKVDIGDVKGTSKAFIPLMVLTYSKRLGSDRQHRSNGVKHSLK